MHHRGPIINFFGHDYSIGLEVLPLALTLHWPLAPA